MRLLAALSLLPLCLGAAMTRAPYLQMSAPTAMTLRWRTDVAEVGRLRWGSAPGSLTNSQDEAGPGTEHEIRVAGLSPATQYFYSVGNASGAVHAGDDADHRFRTHPSAGQAGAYRFWAIGDAGTGNAAQASVRDAFFALTASSGVEADLWLQLGDNAYMTGTDAEFQAKNFGVYPALYRQSPMFACIGNHEGLGAGYYPAFSFPQAGESGGLSSGTEAYYSFDYGDVHFISLDSQNSARGAGGAMHAWLQADLAATTQTWIIAFWHHPPYSRGSHDSDSESQLMEMRANFLPLLEGYGVDLVLAGHSHSYERSRFVDGHYGLSGSFNPGLKLFGGMVVQAGFGRPGTDGAYLKVPGGNSGAVYAVAGSSGQVSGGSLNHPVHLVSLNQLGSMVLDVNGGTLNAFFLRETGAQDDSFTILKASPFTPTPSPTVTPPYTPTPTATPSATQVPPARILIGPNPLRHGSPLCLSLPQLPAGGTATLYAADGSRVSESSFGPELRPCWKPSPLAPGIYFVHVAARWASGGETRKLFKIAAQ